jgi:hypothetical protein
MQASASSADFPDNRYSQLHYFEDLAIYDCDCGIAAGPYVLDRGGIGKIRVK